MNERQKKKIKRLLDRRDYKEAREECDRVLGIDPADEYAYLLRSFALDHLEMCDSAIEDLSAALDIDPSFLQARANRAMLRVRLGEYVGALADSEALIAFEDSNGEELYRSLAVLIAGFCCLKLSRPRDAIAFLDRIRPDDRFWLGDRVQSASGLIEQAIAMISKTRST